MMSFEEAVTRFRELPGNEKNVLANYFDLDVAAAARRFAASDEFRATRALIPSGAKAIMDLGAGMGIASYAFAKAGCDVTAVEPDPSLQVGAGAIRTLAGQEGEEIRVVESFGEALPFPDGSFDVVYARQVLHHARDLPQLCAEVSRVLRTGGVFIAAREHVIRTKADLAAFLDSHPLHRYHGGEHAYTVEEYSGAITGAGLKLERVLKLYDSVINFYPQTAESVWQQGFVRCYEKTRLPRGAYAAWALIRPAVVRLRSLQKMFENRMNDRYYPGNVHTFVASKPEN